MSVDSSGIQGNDDSSSPTISADGNVVTFSSRASNLVGGDTNAEEDIFVHDRSTGITQRVSVDSAGNQGNNASREPAISADGNTVAFHSSADNLVANDTNGVTDVFVHDRVTGITARVSVDSTGTEGNHFSQSPAISADGNIVVFYAGASNLVPNDTNAGSDIFLHDRLTGITERLSVDSDGNQANGASSFPSISADGNIVAFHSLANNLLTGDTNVARDIFVHIRSIGVTNRVSVDNTGDQGNDDSFHPSISADGNTVAFWSHANNLVVGDTNAVLDVFVHDRLIDATERVSVDSAGNQGNDHSSGPAINADGTTVAFESEADNLVESDTNGWEDVFVHDIGDLTPPGRVNKLRISPPSGVYVTTQSFDLVLIIVARKSSVTGVTATLDDVDLTPYILDCAIFGTLISKGETIRCPLGGDFLGEGRHTLDVTVDLSDGSTVSDTVTWRVIGNAEP